MDRPTATEADVSSVCVAISPECPHTIQDQTHKDAAEWAIRSIFIFCTHHRPQRQQQQQKPINIFAVNFMVQNCYYLPVILL